MKDKGIEAAQSVAISWLYRSRTPFDYRQTDFLAKAIAHSVAAYVASKAVAPAVEPPAAVGEAQVYQVVPDEDGNRIEQLTLERDTLRSLLDKIAEVTGLATYEDSCLVPRVRWICESGARDRALMEMLRKELNAW